MGLATEGSTTAEIGGEQGAVAGASPALTAAASAVARSSSKTNLLLLPPAPPRARVSVPTSRCLRMLLGVLKHNPAGVVQEVGVLLMLHAASIEVAKPTAAAADAAAGHADETPTAALVPAKSGIGAGKGRTRHQARVKQREEDAKLKRRVDQAAAVLAVALAAVKTSGMRAARGAGVAATPKKKGGHKTRVRHQLRQPPNVEDGLQAWAATRGREVFGLRELLGLSAGEPPIVQPAPSHAQLVRDRVARISAGKVEKVRTSPFLRRRVHETQSKREETPAYRQQAPSHPLCLSSDGGAL